MEVIAAELQVMGASIDGDVVEKLEVEIIPRREDGRIAHGAVQAAGRDLREAHVARIGGHAQQTHL